MMVTNHDNDFREVLRQVAKVCNQSVALLEQDCYEQAINGFTNALTSVNKSLVTIRDHDEFVDVDYCDSIAFDELLLSSCNCRSLVENASEMYQEHDMTPSSSSSSFLNLYENGIAIPDDCHLSATTFSLILLFNLAVAHHRVATSAAFKKATKLYTLSYDLLLQSEGLQGNSNGAANNEMMVSMSCTMFILVIYNNLGAAYHRLNQSQVASTCLQNVLGLTMLLLDRERADTFNQENSATTKRVVSLLQNSFENVCRYYNCGSLVAPAA